MTCAGLMAHDDIVSRLREHVHEGPPDHLTGHRNPIRAQVRERVRHGKFGKLGMRAVLFADDDNAAIGLLTRI